jgi:hypothetical protein
MNRVRCDFPVFLSTRRSATPSAAKRRSCHAGGREWASCRDRQVPPAFRDRPNPLLSKSMELTEAPPPKSSKSRQRFSRSRGSLPRLARSESRQLGRARHGPGRPQERRASGAAGAGLTEASPPRAPPAPVASPQRRARLRPRPWIRPWRPTSRCCSRGRWTRCCRRRLARRRRHDPPEARQRAGHAPALPSGRAAAGAEARQAERQSYHARAAAAPFEAPRADARGASTRGGTHGTDANPARRAAVASLARIGPGGAAGALSPRRL